MADLLVHTLKNHHPLSQLQWVPDVDGLALQKHIENNVSKPTVQERAEQKACFLSECALWHTANNLICKYKKARSLILLLREFLQFILRQQQSGCVGPSSLCPQ